MFKYRSVYQQVSVLRLENDALAAAQQQLEADLAYMAMMCDVDLEKEEEENDEI